MPEHFIEKIEEFIFNHFTITFSAAMIVYLILTIIIFTNNPYQVLTKYPQWFIVSIVLIGFIIAMGFLFINMKYGTDTRVMMKEKHLGIFLLKFLASVGVLAVLFLIIMFVFYIIQQGPDTSKGIFTILTILGLALGLGLIYKKLGLDIENLNKKLPLPIRVIIDIITYIPCLFINFIEYIKKQNKITTKTEWIVFGIEIVLILIGFLVPYIVKEITTHKGSKLLTKKTYLNYSQIVAKYDDLNKKSTSNENGNGNNYSYHYAISGWIYINPQPPSTSGAYTQNTSLINYGGKPNIMYNGSTNSFIVKAKRARDEDVIIYVTNKLPLQKWNHIVINYSGGTLDVFINNQLVASEADILPYMTHDNLTIGDNPGINGGVDNVYYFDDVLTKSKIASLYQIGHD